MKRVAAYCRVSTDKDDQLNSLDNQKRYFNEYINKSADWELYNIYFDEGKSGTSTKKRAAFNKMISDAELGLFELILTKEISRFARNTLDSIFYTRKLKNLGIGVIFLNDNINTLDPDSELRLTIMSSIAQEESRKTSDRVKWGQKRQMERGVVFGSNVFGYHLQKGKLTVNEEEAETIRLIYGKFLYERKGLHTIALELEQTGLLTKRKNKEWSASSLSRILKNEKYAGDLVQRKSYTSNYLTHETKANRGEEELITIKNNHEPIISREVFDKVQIELKRRGELSGQNKKHTNRYVFSGKLECGLCGSSFISRNKTQNGKMINRWQCGRVFKYGSTHIDNDGNDIGCKNVIIRNEILEQAFLCVFENVITEKEKTLEAVTMAFEAALQTTKGCQSDISRTTRQIERNKTKKSGLLSLYFENVITKDDLKKELAENEKKLQELKAYLEKISRYEYGFKNHDSLLQNINSVVSDIIFAETFSGEVCSELLDKIVVHSRTRFEVCLMSNKYEVVFDCSGCNSSARLVFP